MAEAIARLKTTRPTFYRWLRSGKLQGMKVGRQWRFDRAEIERFLRGEAPQIELRADVQPLIDQLTQRYKEATGKKPQTAEKEGVDLAVDLMIELGLRSHASDIHLAAYNQEAARLRLRIDGVMREWAAFDTRLLPALIARLKTLAACDIHQIATSQDGRIVHERADRQGALDLRACFLPTVLGEAVTIRILERTALHFSLDDLGYSPANREKFLHAVMSPWGLVIIAGPTGSGKTTVIYSALTQINTPEQKIMTVEDPVEYQIPGIVQTPINPHAEMTFPRAIRSIMRSDPDVIAVVEIRDLKTLELCCQLALTGHLVITTLHTTTAAGVPRRMIDMGEPPFLVGDTLRLVGAVRLLRQLCPACSRETRLNKAQLGRAHELLEGSGVRFQELADDFRQAVGCPKCASQGYRGRFQVCEMMEVSEDVARAIRQDASAEELQRAAVRNGMVTLAADGLRRAALGQTTLDEVARVLALR